MSQALVGVQALHQLSWWRPTKQLCPCLFYTASFRNSWKDSSMASSEEYSVYYHCECPNRYKSESPLCLGVLKAPEGQQSRKQYFWNIRKKLGLDVKEVAFVEVVPGKNAETACKGYQDRGYPIVRMKEGYKMLILLKRLHERTGDTERDKNPACMHTHCVMMVLTKRQPSKNNRNPIWEPHARLIKLFSVSYLKIIFMLCNKARLKIGPKMCRQNWISVKNIISFWSTTLLLIQSPILIPFGISRGRGGCQRMRFLQYSH